MCQLTSRRKTISTLVRHIYTIQCCKSDVYSSAKKAMLPGLTILLFKWGEYDENPGRWGRNLIKDSSVKDLSVPERKGAAEQLKAYCDQEFSVAITKGVKNAWVKKMEVAQLFIEAANEDTWSNLTNEWFIHAFINKCQGKFDHMLSQRKKRARRSEAGVAAATARCRCEEFRAPPPKKVAAAAAKTNEVSGLSLSAHSPPAEA